MLNYSSNFQVGGVSESNSGDVDSVNGQTGAVVLASTDLIDTANIPLKDQANTFTADQTAPSFIGDLTGNSDTATALETAKTIAGQSFDGTANISIASTDLTDSSNIAKYDDETKEFTGTGVTSFGGNVGIGITPVTTLDILHPNDVAGGIKLQTSIADSADKSGRIKTAHYSNAEEPITLLYGVNQSSASIINVGGGSGTENAATEIALYIAANNTTLTGNKKFSLTDDGCTIGVSGTGSPQANLEVNTEIAETCKVRINGESTKKSRFELRKYAFSDASEDNNLFYLETQSGGIMSLGSTNASAVDLDIMTFDEDGNVGIGTDSPTNNLYVSKDGNSGYPDRGELATFQNIGGGAGNAIINIFSGSSGKSRIQLGDTGDRDEGYIEFDHSIDKLKIGHNGNVDDITIDSAAGNVGIGTDSPNDGAILDLTSTTKAFMPPRMTATQASAITASDGMMLYVTSTDATFTAVGFWGYENGSWVKL